jgi:multicomponent Na+:H+ antiporter subunit D
MSWLLILPVLVPLATAIASLLALRWRRAQHLLAIGGMGALLALSVALLADVSAHGVRALQLGGWPAPFGISLVADLLSAAMVVITGITGLAVAIFAVGTIDRVRESLGFYPLYHLLLAAVNGSFLTGDLFNLYVWFEVMLISAFVLMALGSDRAQIRGAITYVTLNLVASFSFLAAVGLLYGMANTLNMADLSVRLAATDTPGLATTVAMLLLVAFGIKAAVFPLFYWLPASYHTPPVAVSAVFAGLLTKVGVYALIRVFTLLFTHDVGYTHTLLLVISGLTMLTGVLGAAAHHEVRRILSFHIISQIGYMIMGLALFTPLALAGSIFYILHHIIVKTNLFLVSGAVSRLVGSFELARLGGLYRSRPLLATLFVVPAFSLAGFPPLSGFWAKLILIRAGLEVGEYLIVTVALVVGLLTLFSMTKIWGEAFWKPLADAPAPASGGGLALLVVPMAMLALLTLAIGLWAQPLLELATRSAAQLLDPAVYVEAVLGGGE